VCVRSVFCHCWLDADDNAQRKPRRDIHWGMPLLVRSVARPECDVASPTNAFFIEFLRADFEAMS
jgi:hypothetical protein